MTTQRPIARWAHPVSFDAHYWDLRKEASLKKEAVDWTTIQPMLDHVGPLTDHAVEGWQHFRHATHNVPLLGWAGEIGDAGGRSLGRVGDVLKQPLGLSTIPKGLDAVYRSAGDVTWSMLRPKMDTLLLTSAAIRGKGKFIPKGMEPVYHNWGSLSNVQRLKQVANPARWLATIPDAYMKVQAKGTLGMLNAGLVHGLENTPGQLPQGLRGFSRRMFIGAGDDAYRTGRQMGERMRTNNLVRINELRPEDYRKAFQTAASELQVPTNAATTAIRARLGANVSDAGSAMFEHLQTPDFGTRLTRALTRPDGQGFVKAYRANPFTSGTTTRISSPVSANTIRDIAAPISPGARALPFKQRFSLARRAVFSPPPGAANVGTRLGRSLRLLTHL